MLKCINFTSGDTRNSKKQMPMNKNVTKVVHVLQRDTSPLVHLDLISVWTQYLLAQFWT